MVVGELQEIVTAITNGTALAVSDGSYKEGRGAAAWTIKGSSAKDKVSGACLVPGTTEDHSAFQSEAMGILGTFLTLYHLLGEDGPAVGNLTFSCDGKSALNRAASKQPIGITEPHVDILSAILNVQKQIPYKVSFKHVNGHQDTGYTTALEWDATLNVAMDQQAKEKIEETTQALNYQIPFKGWSCYIGTKKIIKQWHLSLHEHINGGKLCKHWSWTGQLGEGTADLVDWESVRRAMMEVGWQRRKWVTKLATGDFAHGENMRRWRFRTVSQCPRCGQGPEDIKHVFTCPAPLARACWETAIGQLEEWL